MVVVEMEIAALKKFQTFVWLEFQVILGSIVMLAGISGAGIAVDV